MELTYGLDSTTLEVTERELSSHGPALKRAVAHEKRAGKKVTVLVRLEIHEAGDRQLSSFRMVASSHDP